MHDEVKRNSFLTGVKSIVKVVIYFAAINLVPSKMFEKTGVIFYAIVTTAWLACEEK